MGKSKAKLTVAISSTALDLPEHRKEIMNACLEQDLFPKMMEHLPASPDDAITASMALVDSADIYVAIIAFRYGYVPGGHDISITEMEYNQATKIPRLIFLMHNDHPVKKSDVETGPGATKLEDLRKRMEKEQVVNYFKSPADLKARFLNSISKVVHQTANNSLSYDTAIVEMIYPAESVYGSIMNQIEAFPAFPYFSPESDHPSQWPPQIFNERDAFFKAIVQRLSGPAAMELATWRKNNPPKIKRPGTPETDPVYNYSMVRYSLTESGRDFETVRNEIGPACAEALIDLEQMRRGLEENVPNRLLIVRVLNQGDEDITNFRTDISINGSVYDITVNSMGKQAKSEEWTPNRFSIEVPLLQPNYKIDLFVWYYYQPLASKVFPGPMDLKWAQTEGIVIENMVASGVKVIESDHLLNDLPAYNRYPVDPIRNSPTFGRLALSADEEEKAEDAQENVEEDHSYLRVAVPQGEGPYALFFNIQVNKSYRQKNDSYEALAILSNALTSFYEALKTAASNKGGSVVYEYIIPVEAGFNNFTGQYSVSGSLLAIFKTNELIAFTELPGVDVIKNITTINADYIPWASAKYDVVLHFFTDTKDTAGDSKRVLTNKLHLDDIFDTTNKENGSNIISPFFKRLLQFTRNSLEKYYKKNFTLEQEGKATAPFYIVARNSMVSENVYLPKEWMKIEDVDIFEHEEKATLAASLSRLYDYANHSEELDKKEFERLIGKN